MKYLRFYEKSRVIESLGGKKKPEKIIRLIRLTRQRPVNLVRANRGTTEVVEVRNGMRQDDPLYSLLFNEMIEMTMETERYFLFLLFFKQFT